VPHSKSRVFPDVFALWGTIGAKNKKSRHMRRVVQVTAQCVERRYTPIKVSHSWHDEKSLLE